MINEEIEETQADDLETTSEETEEVEEETEEDTKDWKAEALKFKAILDRNKGKEKKAPAKAKQSDEFDYGEYAYLATKGIESDDDIAFVKDAMKDSGKSLRETLNAKWFQAELTERKELSATANAVPKGSKANGTAIDSVEYWLSKPIEEVPANMRGKVVNARLAKEQDSGKFYNS